MTTETDRISGVSEPGPFLAPRQHVENLLPLVRRGDDPVADLVDGPQTPDAITGHGVHLADADAGRRRAAGQQPAPLGPAAFAGGLAFGLVIARTRCRRIILRGI